MHTNDTMRQIQFLSHFVLELFRFIYQLLCVEHDQYAQINFPQALDETHYSAQASLICSKRNIVLSISRIPRPYL